MLWDLPGPRRFLAGIADALAALKHVIVVLPEPLLEDGALLAGLKSHVDANNLGTIVPVDVSLPETDSALDALAMAMDFDPRTIGTIEELLDCVECPSRFIALQGLEKSKPGDEEWKQFFLRAGEHAQVQGAPPFQIVATVTPDALLPPRNVRLSKHFYWGVISQIDIDIVVNQWLDAYPPGGPCQHYWAQALCRGLASTDTSLAQRLIEAMPRKIEEVREVLLEHSRDSIPSEMPQNIVNGHPTLLGERLPPPPHEANGRTLWRQGWLNCQTGQGLVLHASLLATRGQVSELERLVWAGQMSILLPVVEQARLTVVRWLESTFGSDWVETVSTCSDHEDAEERCGEIGGLLHLFNCNPRLQRASRGEPYQLLSRWRSIRNHLAHAEMVPFENLEGALEVLRGFRSA